MGKGYLCTAVIALVVAVACGSGDSVVKPSGHEPAGEVVAVDGAALARWSSSAGEGERDLKVGATVFADDTIVTNPGSSITIRIAHNQVLWNLGGDKQVALAKSASWNAPKASGESLLAGETDDQTAVAGRHAERSAAGTRATATRAVMATEDEAAAPAEPTAPPPIAPPTTMPPPPPTAPTPTPPPPPPPGIGSKYGSGSKIGMRRDRKITLSGQPKVQGGLAKDVVRAKIKQHTDQLRYCYEVARADKPELAGKVTVRFTIDERGVVSEVVIEETTAGYDPLERCLVAKIRRWKFPAPKGGEVTVTYPFVFQAQ